MAGAVDRTWPSPAGPNREQIEEALQRILASTDFTSSDRKSKFLRYIVETTLSGRAPRLKGYDIALEVFDREDSFDAQSDPLVRVEARRLRRSLERYYLTSGALDSVRISIPKGGYTPVFEQITSAQVAKQAPATSIDRKGPDLKRPVGRTRLVLAALFGTAVAAAIFTLAVDYARDGASSVTVSRSSSTAAPTLLVQPFSAVSNSAAEGMFSHGLTEEITVALERFKSLHVAPIGQLIAGSGGSQRSVSDRNRYSYDYVVKGSVQVVDQTVRTVVHLEDTSSGALLWTRVFDARFDWMMPMTIQSDIAAKVATTLGDPYDVLFSNELRKLRIRGVAQDDPYDCILRFHTYWLNPTSDEHRSLRNCHERNANLLPLEAGIWTSLAWLYLDELRFDYNHAADSDPPLERAAEAARRAVSLQPDSARAHLSVAIVQWFRKDFRSFDQHADLALSLNPNDSAVSAELGLRYGLRGDWKRSEPLIDRVISRDPIRWQTYRVSYAQHAVERGDFERALEELRLTKMTDHPVLKVTRAAIYGHLDRIDDARADWSVATREMPRLAEQPLVWIDDRSPSPALRQRIVEGLQKAGLLEPNN